MKHIYKLFIKIISPETIDDENENIEFYFTTKEKMVQYVKDDLTEIYDNDKLYVDKLIGQFQDVLYLHDDDQAIYIGSKQRIIS